MLLPAVCLAAFLLASPEADIQAVLKHQEDDWNRGDIEAFMKGYEDSPSITFSGKAGVTRGYRQVLENYKKRYPTRTDMDTLQFSDIEIRLLGDNAALVLGQFHLINRNLHGHFTLVLRKTAAGWKIIHDHTS